MLVKIDNYIIQDQTLKLLYEQLLLVPGFGVITVLTLLTEIGDYSRFANISSFVKFCGVVPKIDESGGFRKHSKLNRFTNKYIRYVLSQAGGRLINTQQRDTDLSEYAHHQRLRRNLPFKKASLKVANKMAHKIYQILNGMNNYSMTYEIEKRKRDKIKRRIHKKGSALESVYTRALRRDIKDFFVSHSQLLNSTSKYHLVSGFKRLLSKSQFLDDNNNNDCDNNEKEEDM